MSEHWKQPQVAALAQACGAPALLDMPLLSRSLPLAEGPPPPALQWLSQLDKSTQLQIHQPRRLGLYFESLWQFYLQHAPELDLLAHNLPVHQNGRTLGEFDCLYYCHRRQCVVHLELAVKFYLATDCEGEDTTRWIGPNGIDRLDKKLDRLLHHQIALSQHPTGKALLEKHELTPELHEVVVKGQLFHHWRQPVSPPPGFGSQQRLLPWLRQAELSEFLQQQPHKGYAVIDRAQWLLFDGPLYDFARRTNEELLHALLGQSHAVMVAAIDAQGWQLQRFMVVTNNWPNSQ